MAAPDKMAEPDRIEGTIELRGLRVTAVVGVLPEERERAQPLEIDVEVSVDLSAAASSDDLVDTVDYGRLCSVLESTATGERSQLLERLAVRLADAVIGADDRIEAVGLVVRKLRPPVPQDLATSGVAVTRRRRRGASS